MKFLVAVVFLAILASLASALFFLLRGASDDAKRSRRMANALTWRIALSVLLFVCLLLAYKFGLIAPTGLPLQSP